MKKTVSFFKESESVRIDKDVMRRARKYVDGTPMTLSGFISTELRAILDKLSPIKSKKQKQ